MTHKCQRKTELSCVDCRNEAKSSTPNVLRAGLLRLFGMNRDSERPLSIQGETCNMGFTTSNYYSYDKEIETALLEVERKKAEALMEWQKHRLIC
ncbi:MAG: hypothetical protein JSV15_00095 [Candidatus Bathyarchaeota archaeon]|nr:MAG: hypothetical protein JSV15_00095 [Candidatus Bathyarchaeota archaeon]